MKNLFCATIYRMKKTTGVKVAVGLTAVAATLYYVLAFMLSEGKFEMSQAGSITGLGDPMIIWLFGSLMVGLLVGSDFENKTIHGAIKYGRKQIVANFMLVFAIFTVIMVLPYTIGSIVCIALDIGMNGAQATVVSAYMGNILEWDNEASVGKLVLSYISYAIVYIGQLSICVPVAIKLKKTIVVTAFGFFFGMITALLSTLASKVEILDNIYGLTPYSYTIEKVGLGASVSDMLMGILVGLLFTGIMGILSWCLFRKADVK